MVDVLGEEEFTIWSSYLYSNSIILTWQLSDIKFSFSNWIWYFYSLGNFTFSLNLMTPKLWLISHSFLFLGILHNWTRVDTTDIKFLNLQSLVLAIGIHSIRYTSLRNPRPSSTASQPIFNTAFKLQVWKSWKLRGRSVWNYLYNIYEKWIWEHIHIINKM